MPRIRTTSKHPEIVSINSLAALKNDKSNTLYQCQQRFGSLIRSLRGGRTQREFADSLSTFTPAGNSIKQTSIASYENAKALPSLDTFYALVKYTGITADELLNKIFLEEKNKNQSMEIDNDFNRVLSLINFLPLEKIFVLGKSCIERLYNSNFDDSFDSLDDNGQDESNKKKFIDVGSDELQKISLLLKASLKIQKLDYDTLFESEVEIAQASPYFDDLFDNKIVSTSEKILDVISSYCFTVKYWLKTEDEFQPIIDDYSTKYQNYNELKESFKLEKSFILLTDS